MSVNSGLIWTAPSQKKYTVSENFLTWECALRRHGEKPQLEDLEMQHYFIWLLCGTTGDLCDATGYKIFNIDRPTDLRGRVEHVISLWKELRRYTDYYDKYIFSVLEVALRGHEGLYFDVACAVLQPTGIRLHQVEKNKYCVELYHSHTHDIIDNELLIKMIGASKWIKERVEKSPYDRAAIFSQKWSKAGWYHKIYQGALLCVLKNGKIMENKFGGGNYICNSNDGITLCSIKTEYGNTQNISSMPYKLACLCTKIEKIVDLVLEGNIARYEAGWIDHDAEDERLISQIVLKFCLEQYPHFFA